MTSKALESALALLKTDVGGWGAQPALNSLKLHLSTRNNDLKNYLRSQ